MVFQSIGLSGEGSLSSELLNAAFLNTEISHLFIAYLGDSLKASGMDEAIALAAEMMPSSYLLSGIPGAMYYAYYYRNYCGQVSVVLVLICVRSI